MLLPFLNFRERKVSLEERKTEGMQGKNERKRGLHIEMTASNGIYVWFCFPGSNEESRQPENKTKGLLAVVIRSIGSHIST